LMGNVDAVEKPQEGGFAGAVGTDKAHELAFVYCQRHISQRWNVGFVVEGDVVNGECVHDQGM
jgi:hypothetical protein